MRRHGMATYTYTIYDADPNSCGGCEWPTHDGLEIEADDNGEAITEVRAALESAALEARPEDGYAIGQTLYAQITGPDETIVATITHELTASDLGLSDCDITWGDPEHSYVECCYGPEGTDPGDCYTRVGTSTTYHVIQCGDVFGEHESREDADAEAAALNADLVDEYGEGADLGDGAATVSESTQWWFDAGDETDREEHGPYCTEEEARAEAAEYASENDEAESGEDAEAMAKRLLEERAGEPYQDGEWCVYWESSLDYDHVVRRYATCEAATAAAELLASELADRYPGRLRCGYGVRVMRDGEWVRADEVES